MGVAISILLGIIAYKMATNDTTKGTRENTPRCRLFELPAELRIRIYEDALIEEEDVEVSPTKFAPPGLLSTNRQIRHETSRLYYNDNIFKIVADAYDTRLLKRSLKQANGFPVTLIWPECLVE